MIRTTLSVAALGFFALAAGAQTPATTPSPAPAAPRVDKTKPAQPTPPPRVRRIYDDELPMFDLEPLIPLTPLAPLPPMEPMLPMEQLLPMEPMLPFEPMAPLEPLLPFDFEYSMDALPPLEPFAPTPPSEPMLAWPAPELSGVPSIKSVPTVAWSPMASSNCAKGYSCANSLFERQVGDLTSEPPQPWAQADPADSLYRLARQTLNRGEYRRASQLFGDISQRFPNSAYAADARYWKAFALYRIGSADDLREGLRTLESDGRRYSQASLQADAATLASRIRGALAQRGDSRAITSVERAAVQQGEPCDKEDVAVRVQALSSLGDMDQASTTPILKRILTKRDNCSTGLRRSALFLLAKRADPEATNLIISSARNDPDNQVRAEALRWLARMPGDQALATLEEIARTPGNEAHQRAAISALARSESPRARQGIRNIIERTDLSEALRSTALGSVDADNTADGGAYVRAIFPRLESTRLKGSAIRAIARIGGPENDKWLLSLVRNQNEPLDVRTMALSYAGRSAISINDLIQMYDAAGDRPLRERLIGLYSRRTEPEATDKLIAIAKTGTDPEMRRLAISVLSRKNDPRTKQLLLEIIDK